MAKLISVISFQNIQIAFEERSRIVLDDVSFQVERGKRTVLLGANGAGKSSLLAALLGVLAPTLGEITVEGLNVADPAHIAEIRARFGYVGQRPDDLIVSTTVESEVAFGPENLRVPSEELRNRVTSSLQRVGLSGFEKREPATLSGGQKQRLVIAAALAMNPHYVLLDEPCAMLDPRSAKSMLELIEELRVSNIGILHITHNLTEAESADEIIVLHNQGIAFRGNYKELLKHCDKFEEWGIEREAPRIDRPRKELGGETIYDLQDTNVSYESVDGTVAKALTEMNVCIKRGEFVVIEGESGAGKTTLLKVLAGALKPDTGSRAHFEQGELNMKRTRGNVGLVFQDAEQSFFAESAIEEVLFGPLQMGQEPLAARAKSNEVLSLVGLEPEVFAERLPFNLSGGEARRLALASVLSFGPHVVLADEPTASLDAPSRRKVRELLAAESAEKTVIVVTHNPEEFVCLADRHFRISDGRLTELKIEPCTERPATEEVCG